MGDQRNHAIESDEYWQRDRDDEANRGDVRTDGAGVQVDAGRESGVDVAESTVVLRRSASWMRLFDERILELLADETARSAAEISTALATSGDGLDSYSGFVERRCGYLAAAGLLDDVGDGAHAISERGVRYLAGDLDASALPNPRISDESET